MGQKTESFCDAIKQSPDRFRKLAAGLWVPQTEEIKLRLTASYQPMLEVLLYPAAAYFAIMTGFYFALEPLPGFLLLGGISSTTAMACVAMRRSMAGRTLSFHGLEIRGIALFVLVYAGLVAEQIHRLQPEKLTLFMFLMLVTATASVSIRIATAVVVLCTATAFFFAGQASADMQTDVLLVALASSLVAFSMTVMTRLAIMKEICARITAEELRSNAEHLADHDALTELPNRRSFFQVLEKRFGLQRSVEPSFALAIVDLDGFKALNDTFGHAVGDRLLAEAARRLGTVCGKDRFAARLSGDEFAVIIDGFVDEATLRELGQRIRAEIGRPYTILGIRVSVDASVIFVPDQLNIFTTSEMIERADFAMSKAKNEKEGVVVFSEATEDQRRESAAIEHNLRYCDRASEMFVVFQPQIDLASGRTIGFEALGRWDNHELGRIRPDIFIRAAERIGVIQDLSALFLTKALAAAKEWPEDVKLSFNLSIRDIDSPAAIENIRRIVTHSGFPPERIEFEVTETLIMTDFEQAQRSLDLLHEMGSRVGLDDFGVGYANFGHIDQLNINTIKIDRSFVTRLCDSGNSGKIVKTMIDMCVNLGVGCVVEGVETDDELAVLKRLGARYVQGFHFSRPMPAEEIAAHFARELAGRVAEPAERSVLTG
jgi:diguanylate cyclase (GGDEF)-like protein